MPRPQDTTSALLRNSWNGDLLFDIAEHAAHDHTPDELAQILAGLAALAGALLADRCTTLEDRDRIIVAYITRLEDITRHYRGTSARHSAQS